MLMIKFDEIFLFSLCAHRGDISFVELPSTEQIPTLPNNLPNCRTLFDFAEQKLHALNNFQREVKNSKKYQQTNFLIVFLRKYFKI